MEDGEFLIFDRVSWGGVGGAKGVGVRFSRDDFEGRDERFPCRSVSFGGGIFEITLSSFLFSRSFSRF